jgi:hypothetical protein
MKNIKDCVLFILEISLGYSVIGLDESAMDDFCSVNFAMGKPGAIPLFCAAMDLFPSMKGNLIKACEMIGELIWKKGIRDNSNGLMEGTAGNGYMLHCLYRTLAKKASETSFRDFDAQGSVLLQKSYLWRARCFKLTESLIDPDIQEEVVSVPDYPFGLMDGLSGAICLLSDILSEKDDNVRLPGYEI